MYIANVSIDKLTLLGTTKLKKLTSYQLVNGMIKVSDSAVVTLLNINQYSDKYPPQLTVEAGATIKTLQLNSIKKTKVVIDDYANFGKIIHNSKNYDSIATFKADV